jgi:hypothetical protein
MREVFAGFVIGFALALAAGPIAAFAVVSASGKSERARSLAPPGTNFVALSVVLHLAAVLLFTALGIVLGMALAGLEDRRPAGGLGSPPALDTLIVLIAAAIFALPALALPGARRYGVAGALLFAVLFGWAMPWLAEAR